MAPSTPEGPPAAAGSAPPGRPALPALPADDDGPPASPGPDACYSCGQNGRVADSLPPRERILLGTGWRVAHAIRTSLPGWLVVVARRHVTSLAELTADEAAELGVTTWRVSRALTEVTGCVKTYTAMFCDAPGFAHVHVHVVPRSPTMSVDERGPAVFAHMRSPAAGWVSERAMDDMAAAVSLALRSTP